MLRLTLKLLNGVFDFAVGTMILAAALFSVYSIWDNAQIYSSAIDVQDSIRQYRPQTEDGADPSPGFEELQEINEDVIGWLIVEGTNVDYPVLQGDDNLEYMNKDVYGDPSLAGSIFLDSRCDPTFNDRYCIIYGHNMDQHLMFGDLSLFKDVEFFAEHTDAQIITPDGTQVYRVVAIMQLSAGTPEIFDPERWENGFPYMADFLREYSIWYHEDIVSIIEQEPYSVQIASLVTCSEGSTNDRTILVLMRERIDWGVHIDPNDPNYPGGNPDGSTNNDPNKPNTPTPGDSPTPGGGSGPKPTGDGQSPQFWYRIIGGMLLFIACFELIDRLVRRKREGF